MKVGDRIKVIDQEIYGKIIVDHGTEVVIADEDAETEDNHLCFKKSEVEEIKQKGGVEAGFEAQLLFYPETEQLFVKILHYPDPADY